MPAMSDAGFDGGLTYCKTTPTQIDVCSASPGKNFGNIAGLSLAHATIDSTFFTGPAADASSGGGRKLTFNGKTGIPVSTSGTAAVLVFSAPGSSTYVYELATSSTALTSGGTVDVASAKYQIKDPV